MSDTPKNVIEAIAAVMRDLPAIGKDSEVQGDGPKYKFRGIEAITAAAQKLMGAHGVVFVPRIVGMERRDVSVGQRGAVWDEYAVTVEYDVYGPGGVTDCLPQPVRLIGLGRDNSDKGIPKAVTMTYKAALVQVFCIGDSKNDADSERHENADRAEPSEDEKRAEAAAELARIIKDSHPPAIVDAFGRWLIESEYPMQSAKWTDDHIKAIREWIAQVDLTGEIPAPPGSVPVSLIPATEGVGAPDGAGNASRGSGGVMDARVAAAAEYVKSLDSAQLILAFSQRNLRAPRPVGEQRIALAAALVDDENWVPA